MSKNTNLSFLTDYITADITNGRIGINNASPTVAFDVSGATRISGALTLTSTISNGTYTYTLPSATGTLALTSALSGYLPLSGGTLTGALSGTTATFSSSVTATSFGAGSGSNQASIGAGSLGFYNAATSPKYIQLTDDSSTINAIGFSKSGSVATTWFPSGNVGVGTTTPVGFASDDLVFQLYNSGAAPSRAMIRLTNSVSGPTFNNGALLSMDGALDFYVANQEAGNLIFQTSNTERMRITSAGNVGIGTTSPTSLLHLSASGYPSIKIQGGATGGGGIQCLAGSDVYAEMYGEYESANNGVFIFRTRGSSTVSERMRILSNGRVGINQVAPPTLLSMISLTPTSDTLDAVFNITNDIDSSLRIYVTGSASTDKRAAIGPTTNTAFVLQTNTTERMRITSGGNVGIGTTTPTEKLDVNGVIKAASLLLTGTYTTSISTSGAWTSAYQTVIPTGTLQAYYTYLISVHFTNSGAGQPYEVAASLLFSPAVTNGSGSDTAFIPLPSTHTGGSGAYFTFVSIAGTSSTSGLQVLFTNFTNPTGTFYIKATRLQYPS